MQLLLECLLKSDLKLGHLRLVLGLLLLELGCHILREMNILVILLLQ